MSWCKCINSHKSIQHRLTKFREKKNEVLIPDTKGLVNTTALNTKISEIENKLPNTSSLVTATVLSAKIREVGKKIPDHAKYITTLECNMLTAGNFAARSKQANLVTKTDFDNQLTSINRKITSDKTKYLEVQKNLNCLTTKDYNFSLAELTSND